MSCEACVTFDTEVQIDSPLQLVRIGEKVRSAVEDGRLKYESFESDRELIGQPSFMQLDLRSTFPDVMRYHFSCPTCGQVFGLVAETFHGSGGKWNAE